MSDTLHEQIRDKYIQMGFGLSEADKAARDFLHVAAAMFKENRPGKMANP